MPVTKIINISKSDDFEDVFDLFKNTNAEDVILIFPKGSRFVKQEQYFEAIREEAIKSGALAFFKQKYPEVVKVYTIGDEKKPFSREICGGPHVNQTSEIGKFKIVKEESVSAGTRRIRAVVE